MRAARMLLAIAAALGSFLVTGGTAGATSPAQPAIERVTPRQETVVFKGRAKPRQMVRLQARGPSYWTTVGKARASGLAAMSGNDRNRSQQAINDELAEYQARVEKEKAAGVKWPSLNPYVKQPLDETKRMLESEIRRLDSLDTTYLPKSEEGYEEAYTAITKPGATKQEIDQAISKARSAQIPQEYLDKLTQAAPATPAP